MRILLFCCLLPCVMVLHAQHTLWVGAELDAAVPVGNMYKNDKNILKPRFGMQFGGHLLVQYKIGNRVGLEVGAGQNYVYQQFKDQKFKEEHENKYEVLMKVNNYFTSYQASLQYCQPIPGSYVNLYFLGGLRWNQFGTSQDEKSKYYPPDGTTIKFKNNYFGSNKTVLSEAGVQIVTDDEYNMFTLGLQYNLGLSDMMRGELITTNPKNEVIHSDYVTSVGSYIGVVFKYHFKTLHKQKTDKTLLPVAEDKNKPKNPVDNSQRKLVVKQSIKVKQRQITINIIEQYREDNDIVSIMLNDNWIIKNYTVIKKPKTIVVDLKPGRNVLVFHAENLGTIPPNTATIMVIDGAKKYKIDMRSTLDTSEMIEIFYDPFGK